MKHDAAELEKMSRSERKECMNDILREVQRFGSVPHPRLVSIMSVRLGMRKETVADYIATLVDAGYVRVVGTETGPVIEFTTEVG